MISMRFRTALPALLLFLPSISASAQNTIHVPGDQPTIQAGINAASQGDTVLVAPGTYYEIIDFSGKAITVSSSGGASVTTIDGMNAGSVVSFHTSEGQNSVLSGFTITHGNPSFFGGGISIESASPTIENNTITNNQSCSGGGGIYVHFSSAVIRNNTISYNGQGGCSGGDGGGVSIGGAGSVQLLNNTIVGNSMPNGGDGGGVGLNAAGTPVISGNTIQGNSVYNDGGGLSIVNDSNAIVTQNLITGNSAGEGAGIYLIVPFGQPGPVFLNNTVANNAGGSAVYLGYFYQQTQFINNLLIGAGGAPALSCDTQGGAIPPILQDNDAFSPSGSGFAGNCSSAVGSNGNFSSDPLFVNVSQNDFHLQPGSPAIDAGDITNPNLPSQDISGAARLADDSGQCNFVIDLGVYESHPAAPGALSLSTLSLAFPDTAMGTTSSLPLSLTGAGQGCFRLTGFKLTGDFSQTNSCGAGVPAGQSCTVQVAFTPTAGGLRSGTLAIPMNTNSGTPIPAVTLSGNGQGPHGTPSPSPLSFPGQNINSTSTAQTITLTNDGNAVLTVNSVTVTGVFAQTNNCTVALAPGASCSIQVTFSPTAAGQSHGTLSVSSNSSPAIANVPLSGTGIGPQGSLSPVALHFFQQVVGTTSAAQNVTLTNFGGLDMHISSISMYPGYGPDFAQTNNCPATLSAGASCTIQITFTPSTNGWRQGALTVTSDAAPFGPVNMDGYGANAAPVASPSSVNFGDVLLNQTATQNVVLTNPGTTALPINSVTASAPFSASGCAGTVNAGASCTITLTWTPQTIGVQNGTLTINSVAITSVQTLPVTGRGVQPGLTFSPASLTFGNQTVGIQSAAQSVVLSNTGTASYPLTYFSISGSDFSQTNNCPATLAANANCTINVIFTPTQMGALTETLSVTGSPTNVGASMTLSGTGTQAVLSLSPSSLLFPDQLVGTQSGAFPFRLSNAGNASYTVSQININGPDFSQTNNCPATLAANANCTINVAFTPTQMGALTATLSVSGSPANVTASIMLSGTGTQPVLSFSPASLTFANQLVGTQSATQAVVLSNIGTASYTVYQISTSGTDFSQNNNCPASLAVSANCTIYIAFKPAHMGALTATLSVTGSPANLSASMTLSGTGTQAVPSLSQSSLAFGPQMVGSTSSAQVLTLSNTGNVPLTIAAINPPTSFAQSNNCGTSLAAGASCAINVTFAPTTMGAASGSLMLYFGGSASTQSVAVSGTGLEPIATFSPASYAFATQRLGTTSPQQLITLSNTGNSVLTISSLRAAGAIVFSQTNNCPSTLASGASCSIYVTFRPVQVGTYYGNVDLISDSSAVSGTETDDLLSGPGGASTAAVSPSTLSFAATPVGVASAPSTVTLSNSGTLSLNIGSIATSGDFSQSNNCGSSLTPGASCSITVVFTPTASGSRTGGLTVSSDAQNGNVTVSLSGSASDFSMSLSPASVSIKGGKSASFNATVSAIGGTYGSSVVLTCSGLPAATTCSFSPASVIPGSSSQTSTLQITTSSSATPRGTYTIVVSGGANNVIRSATATLIVK